MSALLDPMERREIDLMSTVRASHEARPREWTVADLHRRFGPIPFHRIRQNPPPGTATEEDVALAQRP